MHCGTGVTMSRRRRPRRSGCGGSSSSLSGSLDRAGGMCFHRGAIHRLPPAEVAPAGRRPRAPAAGCRAASRPELPRVVGQMPAVALVDEIEAGNVRGAVRHRRQPAHRVPAAGPLAGRAANARRARGRRRRGERADRARDPRAARDRPARTGRPHARRAHRACAPGCRRRAAVVPPGGGAPAGLVDVRGVGRAMGRRSPGRRRSRRPRRRDVPRRAAGPLAARRGRRVRGRSSRRRRPRVEFGWVHDELLPGGRWSIAPPAMLDTARRPRRSDPSGSRAHAHGGRWRGATRSSTRAAPRSRWFACIPMMRPRRT